jgi:hypothetical protein
VGGSIDGASNNTQEEFSPGIRSLLHVRHDQTEGHGVINLRSVKSYFETGVPKSEASFPFPVSSTFANSAPRKRSRSIAKTWSSANRALMAESAILDIMVESSSE